MSNIKIFGSPQSRAYRALWMAKELGIPYDHVPMGPADTKKGDYASVNPNAKIPALQDGEVVLFESMAINLYLAQKFDKAQVADMFDYIQLHTELVLRAEQMLLEREKGLKPKATADDKARFVELHALEGRIGRTALLTLWPHLHFSRQELSELYELEHHR